MALFSGQQLMEPAKVPEFAGAENAFQPHEYRLR
jgi:hypothetical protein